MAWGQPGVEGLEHARQLEGAQEVPDLGCPTPQAILVLEQNGPAEGRPLVDTVTASRVANMKELRPPSAGRSEVRILFVFDPWRSAVLLVAGDKSGQWKQWYRTAIAQAEQLYEDYLAEREKEAGR